MQNIQNATLALIAAVLGYAMGLDGNASSALAIPIVKALGVAGIFLVGLFRRSPLTPPAPVTVNPPDRPVS